MKDNKLTQVILIILVIICVFQGCSMSSLSSQIDEMNNQLNDIKSDISYLQYRLEDVEENVTSTDSIQVDVSYEISEVDWNTGVVKVDFSVNAVSVSENTRILVGNGYNTYELTKQGNLFRGTVEYPMKADEYETIVYQYEGETEKGYESEGWLSAGTLLSEYMGCVFYGFSSYGNGKLTLAGVLEYELLTDENIKSVQLVTGEKIIELENSKKASIEVNSSEPVTAFINSSTSEVRHIYVKIIAESGITYELYPNIYAGADYQVYEESSMEYAEKDQAESGYINQDNWFVITLPDGTKYETILYSKYAEEYMAE